MEEPEPLAGTSGHTKGSHMTMLEEVCQAIGVVGLPRKGASAQAVRRYILSKREESEHSRLKVRLNKALLKGIENGMLVRPTSSKDSVGATGYFLLAKETEKKVPKAKAAKTKELVSDDGPRTKTTRKKLFVQNDEYNAESKDTKPKSKSDKGKATASKNPNKNETGEMATEAKGKKNESSSKTLKKGENKTLKAQASDSEQSEFAEQKTAQSRALKKPSKIPKTNNIPAKPNESKTGKSIKVSKKKEKGKKPKANEDEDGVSDSEFMVKKKSRKSLKSYSSDSQLMEVFEMEKSISPKKNGPKSRKGLAKSSPEKPEPSLNTTFTNTAEEEEEDGQIKSKSVKSQKGKQRRNVRNEIKTADLHE